jgi:signal transduction histidine kinase
LLAGFLAVAVPPATVLGYLTVALVEAPARAATEYALSAALAGEEARLRGLAERIRHDLEALAPLLAPGEATPELAGQLASGHDLPLLDIVDGEGRVVSSRHWPAGFGLPGDDRGLPGEDSLRRVRVASGHGGAWRLGLTAALPARLGSQPVTLRGGVLLDDRNQLRALLAWPGAEAALRDGDTWLAPAGSPLSAWADLPGAPGGEQAGYAWASRSLAPGLRLVVAVPIGERDAAIARARRTALWTAAGTLLLALVLALALSARIAGPLSTLAGEAQRVAGGDLAPGPAVSGPAEIALLGVAFDTMRAELRSSRVRLGQAERVAAWRELGRRLAHDLRNPLFPIQVSVETLRRAAEREPRPLPQGFRELLDESTGTVLAELRSLRRIVEEFADFARLPAPRPRPTDLAELARQAAGLYAGLAAASGVSVEVDAPPLPSVAADPELLARALGNLVKNGIEAMPTGGRLRIAARVETEATLEVTDSGPGLAEADRERIFAPYVTTKQGGTGLGLAIVQGIVSDHGGRVEVESQPGAGSTFRIVLPRS